MASLESEAEFYLDFDDPSKQNIDEVAKDTLNVAEIDSWADISTSSDDSGAAGVG